MHYALANSITTRTLSKALFAFLVLCFVFSASADDVRAATNDKYASIVMDAETGMILHQRYADKSLHPASLTKMMTLALLFEELDEGRIRLNDRIVVSPYAASMVPSKLNIPAGQSIRVKDAIYALVTKSANDIAVAVAEKIGGSEKNFSKMMTSKARQIGMTGTRFTNASGLHDPAQVSTARDMAKLARFMLVRYPHHYHYFSTKNFSYRGNNYRNHNRLMSSYEGMDGFKTGYVRASGFNLVASATRNNRRLIGVVFGGRSSQTRNSHMAALLDSGFSRMKEIQMANANIPVPERKPPYPIAAAMNDAIAPAAGAATPAASQQEPQRFASINPALSSGMIASLIGEGDFDPAETRRFETGLLAIAAHKGDDLAQSRAKISPVLVKATLGREVGRQLATRLHSPVQQPPSHADIKPAALAPYKTAIQPTARGGRWTVQLGAFGSRIATDEVLTTALHSLPKALAGATPMISPLRTETGLLYRARLEGYSKSEALRACQYLRECIVIGPGEN